MEPSGLVIAAGTYDGVLAGWELDEKKGLDLTFATAVHTGSIRSLSMASSPNADEPGQLLSCGYDETLRTHEWQKRTTSAGEIRTPGDFGTPVCSSFAPPRGVSSHCIIGFSNGKICIYKKRDWSVQHTLGGHEGGVNTIAVHPSGKLALSGGLVDGKLKLWDLTKGRLAFVNKIKDSSSSGSGGHFNTIESIVWSKDGLFYALSYGSHLSVREVASGKPLLDVDLPSRVNQVALMSGAEGLFAVAACNDGSLPVLLVEDSSDENRRAIMAIEPVTTLVAKEERFKCLSHVTKYCVVTANSAGVVSVMNLAGAVRMITSPNDESSDADSEDDDDDVGLEEESEDNENVESAVDIVASTQLGTGARVTCLAAWCKDESIMDKPEGNQSQDNIVTQKSTEKKHGSRHDDKRKQGHSEKALDADAVKRARSLVEHAKSIKRRKNKKAKKSSSIPSN